MRGRFLRLLMPFTSTRSIGFRSTPSSSQIMALSKRRYISDRMWPLYVGERVSVRSQSCTKAGRTSFRYISPHLGRMCRLIMLRYREFTFLKRPLTIAEATEVTNMARRLTQLCLMQPALDANYQRVKASTYPWPSTNNEAEVKVATPSNGE